MKCHDIQNQLLTDFLDDQLPAGRKALIDRHLMECADCRHFLAAVKKVNDPLWVIDGVEPAPHVWSRVRDQVEAQPVSLGQNIRAWFEEVLWGFRPTFV